MQPEDSIMPEQLPSTREKVLCIKLIIWGFRASILLPLTISVTSTSGFNHKSKQAIIQFSYVLFPSDLPQEEKPAAAVPCRPSWQGCWVGQGCPTALCSLPAFLIRQQELQCSRETGAAFPPECFSEHNSCSIYIEAPETKSIPAASKAWR